MQVTYTRDALKGLRRMPEAKRLDVIETMKRVAHDPSVRDNNIKPLKGIENAFRRRFGDWRVSYIVDRAGNVIEVFEVAPRGGAYR